MAYRHAGETVAAELGIGHLNVRFLVAPLPGSWKYAQQSSQHKQIPPCRRSHSTAVQSRALLLMMTIPLLRRRLRATPARAAPPPNGSG